MSYRIYQPTQEEKDLFFKHLEEKRQLENLLKKFQEQLPSGGFEPNQNSDKRIEGAIRSFPAKIVLEWCTPKRLREGIREIPCCTYDGCGGSDDEPGATCTEHYAEAKGSNGWTLRISSVKTATKQRRYVLSRVFKAARQNLPLREMVREYAPQIREFLRSYK